MIALCIAAVLLALAGSALADGNAGRAATQPAERGTPGERTVRAMRTAMRDAPLERNGRCATTIDVPGLGPACRTRGGLFRLTTPGSPTTHGLDGPPQTAAAPHTVASETAIDNASVADISCVDPDVEKHFKLVYAHGSDQASRYATIAPLLREETYKASAFVNAESKAVDSTKSKRLKLDCGGGATPTVTEVQLPTASGSSSFSTVSADLHTLAVTGSFGPTTLSRLIVFYDAPVGGGAAGTGHLFTNDSAQANSPNNYGGLVAVEFRWDDTPHWDVLLHEASHNMGAVQPSAANASNTSSAAHCNDGIDVMCYADGEPQSNYSTTTCALEYFDCGRDDYFHPSPPGGHYLASHWNLAASYNAYLQHSTNMGGGDITAPTTPGAPNVTSPTASSLTLNWGVSTDAVGVAGYRVFKREFGIWTLVTQLNSGGATSHAVTGLWSQTSYDLAVSAYDAAGNESALAMATGSTTSSGGGGGGGGGDGGDGVGNPPEPTSQVAVTALSPGSVSFTWAAASDDVGVVGYDIQMVDDGDWRLLATTGSRSFKVTGLAANTEYTFGIVSLDGDDNSSEVAEFSISTTRDTQAPGRPGKVRVVGRTRSSISLGWNPAVDDGTIVRYEVFMQKGRSWRKVGATGTRKFTKKRIAAGRKYRFRVRAIDSAGNAGMWSSVTTGKTTRSRRR